jgi:hypothetical protein
MARAFSATEPESALRAYLVLIGCAADRKTVTFEELSRQIKRGGPNLLARSLDLLTQWCKASGLPALAALVVERSTGLPAPGFAAVSWVEIPAEQERAWDFDCFAIHPPMVEELAQGVKGSTAVSPPSPWRP